MVYLSKIYTRFGDEGQTQLGDGQSVSKTHPRVAAMGDVDELNCQLGCLLGEEMPARHVNRLVLIQNQLFDLGADLCVPDEPQNPEQMKLRITAEDVTRLEGWIDELNGDLEPLRSFILPGGGRVSAGLHLARAVCRRAERQCWELGAVEAVNPQIMIYLNRLSDFLFVLARVASREAGHEDQLWQPLSSRGQT